MRFTALIPVVCCLAALILTLLSLFAGSSPGFMEDYSLVTMNTSRIGYNIFNTSESTSSDNPITNFIHNVTDTIEDFVENAINSVAKELGLHDFYTSHLLTFCEGYYTPGPVPNASLPLSDIHKNVTSCSNKTTTFYFNPTQVLQNELDEAGHGDIQLKDLEWPPVVEDAFKKMRFASRVTFAFYCISIVFIFISLLLAIAGVFWEGRASACVNLTVGLITFTVVLVASAISTYIAIESTKIINNNLDRIGISASTGGKFLALTWVSTVLILISTLVWSTSCILGARKRRRTKTKYTSEPKRI